MLDPRFYVVTSTPTVAELSNLLPLGPVRGDVNRRLTGFEPYDVANTGDLTFYSGKKRPDLSACQAAACIVDQLPTEPLPEHLTIIQSDDPRASFSAAAALMAQRLELEPQDPQINKQAVISPEAVIEPGAVIGKGASIGEGSRVGAGAVIGPGVQIGRRCRVGANATIYCALVGDDVSLFPGAVIGENGFGLSHDASRLIAHFGRVILQDRVTIGANSCVDRGMLGDTVIGERTHIDNLCHIGHNVTIGSRAVMAAFAGVSGSSRVGDGVMFGGRVGLADHVTVGQGARIAAGAAVLGDVPAGETWVGYPAKPRKEWVRELAWLRRSAQKRSDGVG